MLAAVGGYQRHDGHYVCNLHSVPCTSPGLATVVAEVSREKKRVILKRKLNLLHVEYEENNKNAKATLRHDNGKVEITFLVRTLLFVGGCSTSNK